MSPFVPIRLPALNRPSSRRTFGKVYAGSSKRLLGDALKNNNPNEVCRSHWGYRYMEEAVPTKLIKQVLKAAKVIGLELGAADVLEKDGKFYICELNTAYSVDTPLLTKWSRKNILEYVQKKFPTFDLSRETQQTVE